jgi:hypothetical protein
LGEIKYIISVQFDTFHLTLQGHQPEKEKKKLRIHSQSTIIFFFLVENQKENAHNVKKYFYTLSQ